MVYVDPIRKWWMVGKVGPYWCHMVADSVEELHEFAAKIGLKREWYQCESMAHYDLVPSKRTLAIKMGAKALEDEDFEEHAMIARAQLVECIRAQAVIDEGRMFKVLAIHCIICPQCKEYLRGRTSAPIDQGNVRPE